MADDTPAPCDLEPQLRAALAELERRLRAGTLRGAEELRDTFPDLWNDADSALELVYAEYVLRAGGGEAPQRDDWYRRFPQWRERLERLFALYDVIAVGDTNPEHAGRRSLIADDVPPRLLPLPDLPGYELFGEIGRGGMGVVYKARQVELNRVVAVKMLRDGVLSRDEDAERIRREAEAVARLQHPNIVQIHEIGDAGGVPFLCLEYVDGGSLEEALVRWQRPGQPSVSPHDAARLVETLARAMHAAHQQGVVHRDLKPANVLLANADCGIRNAESKPEVIGSGLDSAFRTPQSAFTPKVTDFGLAIVAEAPGGPTRTGAVVGTPCYMAPEQAAGDKKAIGPRTDVYALGGILYQLLTGRPPFEGSTPLETLEQVRHAEPVPPSRLRPKLPRDLETICLKCLRKEPARRYDSAAELADDLRRFLAGEPIRARPVSSLERGVKWARRRPSVAALAAAVLGLVVASVAILWAKSEAAEQARRNEERLLQDKYETSEKARVDLENKQRELEKTLAGERFARAAAIYNNNEAPLAKQVLDQMPEQYRDEPWHALYRECSAEVGSIPLKLSSCGGMAVSPDGTRLAVFSWYLQGVQVFDAATGKPIATVPTEGWVQTVAFTADGGTLVVVPNLNARDVKTYTAKYKRDPPDRVVVWDVAKQETVSTWKLAPSIIPELRISGDGRRIVTSDGPRRVWVWDSLTGAVVADLSTGPEGLWGDQLAIDDRGRRLATLHATKIKVWDVASRQVTHTIRVDKQPLAVRFSPDGDVFVWCTWHRDPAKSTVNIGYTLTGWDVTRGQELFQIGSTGLNMQRRLLFSPNGRLFAFQDMIPIYLHDSRTGARVATLRGDRVGIIDMAFSPDSRRLYSVDINYAFKTWDVAPWTDAAAAQP